MAARSVLPAVALALTSLVAGGASAAEWSLAPLFFANADHQSNRTLRPETPESQSLGASLDLDLTRLSETAEFSLAPHYYLRRIQPSIEADIDDLRIPASLRLDFERGQMQLGGLYADESTLTTELETTGAISAAASRITRAIDTSFGLSHSDARELQLSASFQDVNYTGGYEGQLYDYRYGSASLGERFTWSTRTAFTLSGFASQLRSSQRGNENQEAGVSLGMDFAFTENTFMSATFGVSRRDFDGSHSNGRLGSFSLSHQGETRRWHVSLDHSLVPFGTGVLTERDTAEFALTQQFDTHWLGMLRLGWSRNEDAQPVFNNIDARTYRHADLELRWQLDPAWSVSMVSGYADAQDPGAPERVNGWSLALRTTWAPTRRVIRT